MRIRSKQLHRTQETQSSCNYCYVRLLAAYGAIVTLLLWFQTTQGVYSMMELLQVQHGVPGNDNADAPVPAKTTTCDLNDEASLCECVNSRAAGIWSSADFQRKLHQATLEALKACWWFQEFPKDLDMTKFEQFTSRQLELLTPSRLKAALRTSADPTIFQKVAQIVRKRLQNPDTNPPLRIAVFGGSVTEGCRAAEHNPFDLHPMQNHYRPSCTWVKKLETMANSLLANYSKNQTLVEVKNFAIAGTDSDVATALLEYQLTEDLKQYDVFISSFSSNDGLAPPGRDRDRHLLSMQRLNRLFYDQRPCHDLPLIVQLEDTLLETVAVQGVKPVYEGLKYNQDMVQSNAWAGRHFMSLSYADATRDLLYHDVSDQSVHSFGSVHPGYQMHTGIAYMVLYHFLEGLLEGVCDTDNNNSEEASLGLPLPMITHKNSKTSEDMINLWSQQKQQRSQLCSNGPPEQHVIPGTASHCEYGWVAAPWAAKFRLDVWKKLEPYITSIQGWEAAGSPDAKPKRMWRTETAGSKFTMQFNNLKTDNVNSFLLTFMRSDDVKWRGSVLEVVIEHQSSSAAGDDWKQIIRGKVEAHHTTRSTINYARRIKFWNSIPKGDNLRFTFTLVGGSNFQITGMALCHITPSSPTDPTTYPEGYEDPSIPLTKKDPAIPPEDQQGTPTRYTNGAKIGDSSAGAPKVFLH